MGTYYTLGVVKKFVADTEASYSEAKWKQFLDERLDTSLYNLSIEDDGKSISGSLREGVFESNIEDFYNKLIKITNDRFLKEYFEEGGGNIDDYQDDEIKISFSIDRNIEITLHLEYVLLFIEGKVSVEEFSIEPKLMNWLFRHCDFGNCLSGCIVSSITG